MDPIGGTTRTYRTSPVELILRGLLEKCSQMPLVCASGQLKLRQNRGNSSTGPPREKQPAYQLNYSRSPPSITRSIGRVCRRCGSAVLSLLVSSRKRRLRRRVPRAAYVRKAELAHSSIESDPKLRSMRMNAGSWAHARGRSFDIWTLRLFFGQIASVTTPGSPLS